MTRLLSHGSFLRVSSGTAILDDGAALRRYSQTGDPAAFAVLIERYQNMVLATAQRVVRSRADAEDAAQETFLKLARNTANIQSNVAAWLHACAVGTATDLLRREGSRERAERAAADRGVARTLAEGEARTPWSEIEPLLDAALAELLEDDRNAVIGHYLAGRAQKDLAREAGVSPGTMSRRIERALDALQTSLRNSGLALPGAAGLGAVLAAGATSAPAEASFSVSLAKVALAESALSGKRAVVSGTLGILSGKSAMLAATITLVAGGLGLVAADVGGGRTMLAGMLGVVDEPKSKNAPASVPRPTEMSGLFAPVRMTMDGQTDYVGRLTIEDDRIVFQQKVREQDPVPKIVLTRESTSVEGETTTIRVKFSAAENVDSSNKESLVGKSGTVTATTEGEVLVLGLQLDGADRDMGKIRLVRPEIPRSKTDGQDDAGKKQPADTGTERKDAAGGSRGKEPLSGEWLQLMDTSLRLDAESICYMGTKDFVMQQYKILSWEEADGHSRVETICAENRNDTGMLGKRFKILIRKDTDGYTVAQHGPYSKNIGTWPSFEPKKGDGVRVLTFVEEK